MTDTPASLPPAGWYADPSNPALQRWWDGTAWTGHLSPPAVGSPQSVPAYGSQAYTQLLAPEGTNGSTPWIWLNVLLPVLGLVPNIAGLFVDQSVVLEQVENIDTAPELLALYSSPAVLLGFALSGVIIVGTIVFAYLDWRELKRRGVPQPFHWAFAFLGLIGIFAAVYPIGRALVVKRRTGRSGAGVITAAIVIATISVILVMASMVIGFAAGLASVPGYPGG